MATAVPAAGEDTNLDAACATVAARRDVRMAERP